MKTAIVALSLVAAALTHASTVEAASAKFEQRGGTKFGSTQFHSRGKGVQPAASVRKFNNASIGKGSVVNGGNGKTAAGNQVCRNGRERCLGNLFGLSGVELAEKPGVKSPAFGGAKGSNGGSQFSSGNGSNIGSQFGSGKGSNAAPTGYKVGSPTAPLQPQGYKTGTAAPQGYPTGAAGQATSEPLGANKEKAPEQQAMMPQTGNTQGGSMVPQGLASQKE